MCACPSSCGRRPGRALRLGSVVLRSLGMRKGKSPAKAIPDYIETRSVGTVWCCVPRTAAFWPVVEVRPASTGGRLRLVVGPPQACAAPSTPASRKTCRAVGPNLVQLSARVTVHRRCRPPPRWSNKKQKLAELGPTLGAACPKVGRSRPKLGRAQPQMRSKVAHMRPRSGQSCSKPAPPLMVVAQESAPHCSCRNLHRSGRVQPQCDRPNDTQVSGCRSTHQLPRLRNLQQVFQMHSYGARRVSRRYTRTVLARRCSAGRAAAHRLRNHPRTAPKWRGGMHVRGVSLPEFRPVRARFWQTLANIDQLESSLVIFRLRFAQTWPTSARFVRSLANNGQDWPKVAQQRPKPASIASLTLCHNRPLQGRRDHKASAEGGASQGGAAYSTGKGAQRAHVTSVRGHVGTRTRAPGSERPTSPPCRSACAADAQRWPRASTRTRGASRRRSCRRPRERVGRRMLSGYWAMTVQRVAIVEPTRRPRNDTPSRPNLDPKSVLDRLQIDPKSSPGRPRIDPGSTSNRPQIDLARPQLDPKSAPRRPKTTLQSDRQHIDPNRPRTNNFEAAPRRSQVDPRSTPGRPIDPRFDPTSAPI